jgi:hypothetical protein
VFDFKALLPGGRRHSPSGAERRLHNRALLYWDQQRESHAFPLVLDFDAARLEDMHSHGFLLDLSPAGEPCVAMIGDVLRDEADLAGGPARLHDIKATSLLGQFAGRYHTVLEERRPFTSEYVFTTEADYRVSCRGVLLPLSSDGTSIDHIYGVISWKSEKISEHAGAGHESSSGVD